MFSEYGLLKKIKSDTGINFISNKFKQCCKNLSIEQATSSYCDTHEIQGKSKELLDIT